MGLLVPTGLTPVTLTLISQWTSFPLAFPGERVFLANCCHFHAQNLQISSQLQEQPHAGSWFHCVVTSEGVEASGTDMWPACQGGQLDLY